MNVDPSYLHLVAAAAAVAAGNADVEEEVEGHTVAVAVRYSSLHSA